MTRRTRSFALAAILFAVCLAGPAAGNASRAGLRSTPDETVAVTRQVSVGSLLGDYLESAWNWLSSLVDEENGHILP
jgi:hypothetical protein